MWLARPVLRAVPLVRASTRLFSEDAAAHTGISGVVLLMALHVLVVLLM